MTVWGCFFALAEQYPTLTQILIKSCFLDIAQLAQELRNVNLDAVPVWRTKYVTAWISGDVKHIELLRDFNKFLRAVSDVFDFATESLRIYVLESCTSPWQDKIRLSADNFHAFTKGQSPLQWANKLYAISGKSFSSW